MRATEVVSSRTHTTHMHLFKEVMTKKNSVSVNLKSFWFGHKEDFFRLGNYSGDCLKCIQMRATWVQQWFRVLTRRFVFNAGTMSIASPFFRVLFGDVFTMLWILVSIKVATNSCRLWFRSYMIHGSIVEMRNFFPTSTQSDICIHSWKLFVFIFHWQLKNFFR